MKKIFKDVLETAGLALTVVAIVWIAVSVAGIFLLGYDLCQFFSNAVTSTAP